MSDKITIQNWYTSPAYRIEAFETADGGNLTSNEAQDFDRMQLRTRPGTSL